eukprot:TRINITY_DN29709_c0_g1_i1.p1 TRINITY_DN29709_c0_g1~~TRINITY_DN29709_c0_g1_i1.p1  ORF type:complete len:262 (+),score=47.66 TRINITY_DN29709_c0_g1_i1:56-841(+)
MRRLSTLERHCWRFLPALHRGPLPVPKAAAGFQLSCAVGQRPTALTSQLRCWASEERRKSEYLVCAKDTNVGKFAGAIAARIREKESCAIDCVGPMPVYKALKAMTLASGYLTEERKDGKILCVYAEQAKMSNAAPPESGRNPATIVTRLHVSPVVPPPKEDEPELILIGADTNAGLAAGLIAKVFDNKGVAAVAGMGAASMSKAVKAVAVTQSYLRKNDRLPDKKVLAAAVRTEFFKEGEEDLKCQPFQIGSSLVTVVTP